MNDSSAPRSRSPDPFSALRVAALIAAILGVLVLAAAAFVLSYPGIHQLARTAGMSVTLARVFPVIFDALLVVAIAAVLSLHGAGWWRRGYSWLITLLLVAAMAAGGVLHAVHPHIPHRPAAITAAVLPWALLLIAFSLLLSILRQFRQTRLSPAASLPATPAPASPAPAGSDRAGTRIGLDALLAGGTARIVPAQPSPADTKAQASAPADTKPASTTPADPAATGTTRADSTTPTGTGWAGPSRQDPGHQNGATSNGAAGHQPAANGSADSGTKAADAEPVVAESTDSAPNDSAPNDSASTETEPTETEPGGTAPDSSADHAEDETGDDEPAEDEPARDEPTAESAASTPGETPPGESGAAPAPRAGADGPASPGEPQASPGAGTIHVPHQPMRAPVPAPSPHFDRLRSTPTPPEDDPDADS